MKNYRDLILGEVVSIIYYIPLFYMVRIFNQQNQQYILCIGIRRRKKKGFHKTGITKPMPRARYVYLFLKVLSKTKRFNILEQTTDTYWESYLLVEL